MEVCQIQKDGRGPKWFLSLHMREILPHKGQKDNLEINKENMLCIHMELRLMI